MDFRADFTAIDFETANRRRDSACQLAAVVVRDGRIVDQAMWMIRPEPLYFSRGNIEIHGITPEKVRAEPVFADIWSDVAQRIGDDCIVAHNASFDIGVLLACLRQADHAIPDLHFTCTRAIARRVWPHRPRFGLKPLSDWLGIRFKHHDALEDSVACAKILLAAGIDREAESLDDLETRLQLRRGRAGDWGYRGPRASTNPGRRRSHQLSITRGTRSLVDPTSNLPFLVPGQTGPNVAAETKASFHVAKSAAELSPVIDVQRLMVRAEFIRPLAGQRVVLTGRLCNLSPGDAKLLATRLGADCQNSLDAKTDLLVVGRSDSSSEVEGRSPSEMEAAAKQMQSDGCEVRIVDEAGFLELLIAPVEQALL